MKRGLNQGVELYANVGAIDFGKVSQRWYWCRTAYQGGENGDSAAKCRYRHFVPENIIRPVALNRKNALFAGHDEGGTAWSRIASLVEPAKLNRVNPHAYLKATLEAIANGHPAS